MLRRFHQRRLQVQRFDNPPTLARDQRLLTSISFARGINDRLSALLRGVTGVLERLCILSFLDGVPGISTGIDASEILKEKLLECSTHLSTLKDQ